MKILVMLILILNSIVSFSQEKENSKAHHNSVHIATVFAIKQINNYEDANDELVRVCRDWEDSFDTLSSCQNSEYQDKLYTEMKEGDNDPTHAPGTQVFHCYDKSEGDPNGQKYFCFNGQLVKDNPNDNGANRLMMGYLCTDDKLPVVKQAIVFGSCELKDQIITEQDSCYCQYVNGQKKNGLAWHCTRKN